MENTTITDVKQKVVAYITRERNGQRELLVNIHRDFIHDAGSQVPAGTVEPNEDLEVALFREIEEEAGLTQEQLSLVKYIGAYPFYRADRDEHHERHVYHLVPAVELPDTWMHYDPFADGKTVVLIYFWVPMSHIDLSGKLGDYLDGL